MISLVWPAFSSGQFIYRLSTDVQVTDEGGHGLPLAWAGGFNSAQFSTLDLDGDGDDDLVLFDRTSNSLLTYLAEAGQYLPAPEYAWLFPADIRNWMLLRDFNCDGKKDIFCSDAFGVRVFVNMTEPGQPLMWRPYHPGSPLLTQGFSGSINLKINETDIPSVDDIDGDGDLDIINARFVGSGTLEYHQNMTLERTGTCDSMQFVRVTQAWGGVEDCTCNVFSFGGVPCPSGGRAEHAGGKALLTLDADNDGDRDLLFSQEECSRVHLLINGGDNNNAVFNSATLFPPGTPINFLIFPAVYHEDLDFDGRKDLIASPNIYSRNFLNVNFSASGRFYKNIQPSGAPEFSFVQTNFLQDQSIDVGENSVPAFADADGDGDPDLFIGNAGTFDNPASLTHYTNVGSLAQAAFRLEDEDYLGLSIAGLTDIKPQFADMNHDGRIDLAFTAFDPRNGNTSLYYAPNQTNFGLDLGGQTVVNTAFTVSSGESVHVTDVNLDGYADVLLGKSNGAMEYWQHTGDEDDFSLTLTDPTYLGFGSSVLYSNMNLSTSDLDLDGKEDLIFGLSNGTFSVMPDFRNADDATLPLDELIYDPFTETYGAPNLGGRIWPVAVNLFSETRLSLVAGNTQGGLRLLRADGAEALPENPEIVVYPNPPGQDKIVYVRSDRPSRVQIFSSVGQGLGQAIQLTAYEEGDFNVQGLAPGLYIVRFVVEGRSYGRKLAIVN